ncbi:phage antirepressor [Streptomyces sp. NPDC101115]|uniref:phage antirepressor n=1 Tax=Streptomyces sp. NPDC101115 TaxID=3366106 RepID=UPI0038178588
MPQQHPTELSPVVFPMTGEAVRILDIDGDPWFVARDVFAILGLTNTTEAMRSLDDDEFSTAEVVDSAGRRQPNAYIVSEPGLYSLVMRSRKPQARAFKRWVRHDVLPSIRRTGKYEVSVPVLGDPLDELERTADMLRQAIGVAREERAGREAAEQRAAALEPSAAAWDTLAAEEAGDFDLREAAQLLSRDVCIQIGRNTLARALRDLGWCGPDGQPYQRAVTAGRLVRRTYRFDNPNTGLPQIGTQVRITLKGLAALRDELGCRRTQTVLFPA